MKFIPGRMYKALRTRWLSTRGGSSCLYVKGEVVLVVGISRDRVMMLGSDGDVHAVVPETNMFRWVKVS